MSPPPEPEVYKPPPEAACDPLVYPFEITETDRILTRLWFYKGKTVDFAICQHAKHEGQWMDVARIDCCGGIIHRHQYNQVGEDVYDHRPIQVIDRATAWNTLGPAADNAYDVMFNEWEANLRRWRDGR